MKIEMEASLKNDGKIEVLLPMFEKRTVTELTDSELSDINGGSTPILASISAVGATIAIAQAGYKFGQWLAS